MRTSRRLSKARYEIFEEIEPIQTGLERYEKSVIFIGLAIAAILGYLFLTRW